MIKITMFSAADSVKGQGVGSVYLELVKLLKTRASDQLTIQINRYGRSDISHYHTVNFPYYLSTFMPGRGRKIGFVHFLPETLEGSLKLPKIAKAVFYRYVIAFYKRMDQLVVVNPSFISKLEAYGIPKEHITYIPNFVSATSFHPADAETKLHLRKQYGYQDRFTILGSGQVQVRKGVFDFIELAKRHPEMQFIWTGGFSFGRITDGYEDLKQVVDNPPDNLSFPGIVDRDKLVDYYNMADLFLLPSYNELFPMSVLEAFSTHTPVLLRDLDLYHAIIQDDYAAAKDVEEMDAWIKKLSTDEQALTALKTKAKHAADYYSEARLAKIWIEFYTEQAKRGK
ncbi:glycosyltransferase [Secundilactobacillus odoratitofui DSM 19909 = JCM 15043]|uniref:Glycosyltransferase n=1 Tax=Secundilactobacillus odoratitofui DSM 19909 = JCM 15043 TaxID=1423776 RepID=A0A0R1LN13_9LACO|nr:glycosyltransferase family 4 protein [Secundilactobacillus odoratitofui]KRK97229.1 glycosyltransferase [Secundilactobacillus odoratitofui DSM 19909 = JCM 15043]